MSKYVFYFLMPVLVPLMVLTLPDSWKRTKRKRTLLAVYGAAAVLSFTAMISAASFVRGPVERLVLDYGALFFFTVTVSAIVVSLLRYLLAYICIQLHAWSAVETLHNNRGYAVAVALCAAFILGVGSSHFNGCRVMTYDVNLTDGTSEHPSQCTVALLSDIHLGAGAGDALVDRMCAQVAELRPDLVCIDGDLVDMMTLQEDLDSFADKISRLSPKYGVIYVEGNHEKDSDLDCRAALEKRGILCLYDEAVVLENGLAVAGRRDAHEVPVPEILSAASVPEDAPAVVLSHRPADLTEMSDHPYLVLCGHTHGYQIPIFGLINPYLSDLPYGYRAFGRMRAVTSAGAAAWGFRIKWPSYNEICLVRVVY